MHELGVVIEVVNQVEEFARENGIEKINTLVLQVGELCSMVPRYIEDVYPIAVEKTSLRDTRLQIEVTTGLVKCNDCGLSYPVIDNDHKCPRCGHREWKVITGTEFLIKEILVE